MSTSLKAAVTGFAVGFAVLFGAATAGQAAPASLLKNEIVAQQQQLTLENVKFGDRIKRAAKKVGNGITKGAQKVKQGTQKAVGKIKNGTAKVGKGIRNGAKKVGNGFKRGARKIKNVSRKAFETGKAVVKAGRKAKDLADEVRPRKRVFNRIPVLRRR